MPDRGTTTQRLRDAIRERLRSAVGMELPSTSALSWEISAGLAFSDELQIRFATVDDVAPDESPRAAPGSAEFALWVSNRGRARLILQARLGVRADASALESLLWEWLDARVAWAPAVDDWSTVDDRRRDEDAGEPLMRELLGDVALAAISDLQHELREHERPQIWLFFVSDGTAHGWAHRWTHSHNAAGVLAPIDDELLEDSWEEAAAHDGGDPGGDLGPDRWRPRPSGL